jgi:peptidoglycan/LPS O-acetylase OafA/YrhL
MVASQTKKIYPLTSVRFFAAFLVVLHHSAANFTKISTKIVPIQNPLNFVDRGLFGFTFAVSFFFLLSGYVLARVYLRDGRGLDKRRFFAARFARIYPLYFVMIVFDTRPLLLAEVRQNGMETGLIKTAGIFAANLVMLQTWFAAHLVRIDVPSWTLCAEVFFYICFPVLGAWIWRLNGAHLWMTAAAWYIGGQMLVWALRPHINLSTLVSLPLLHLSTFALGVMLARWQTLQQMQRNGAETPLWQVYTVLLLATAGVILSILLLSRFHVASPYDNGLLSPVFAGFIWALSVRPTVWSRWLGAGWLVALGNASYALYLIHYPIMTLFVEFHWVGRGFYLFYLVVVLSLSLLSFYYFETPMRAWLFRKLHTRSLESMEAASIAQ